MYFAFEEKFMAQSMQLTIKPFLLGRPRLLVIEPGFITFGENKQRSSKFLKNEIAAVRYGLRGIRGYSFNIGRVYCIDIKNSGGEIIKIRFRSFYRIRRQVLDEQYLKIIKAVSENFIHDISRAYLKKFAAKEEFEILGIIFSQGGLILDEKWDIIPWLDVSTKNYNTYYALFSMTEPEKYKAFKYLNDWNTAVLYGVSRRILKDKGFWHE